MQIIELSPQQVDYIETQLEAYDNSHIPFKQEGSIRLGILENGELIAGVDACMTAYHILYVSTAFVADGYRRQGYGKTLILELEKRAKLLGADTIRLDTFDWQGKQFYEALGYQIVGSYENKEDGYCEYFFLKRI